MVFTIRQLTVWQSLKNKRTFAMRFPGKILPLSAIIAALSNPAFAEIEPASVAVGEMDLVPTMNLQVGYDDNILSANTNEISSMVTVLSPSVQLIAEQGLNAYRMSYTLSKGVFENSSDDNYLDHNLAFDAHLEFDSRNKLDLRADYNRGHEARGTGLSANNGVANAVTEPLEYDTRAVSFNYQFGGDDATGRLEFYGELLDREYNNFRNITEGRDNQERIAGGIFFYRIAPKTSLLFEARNKDVDYDLSTSTLDSNTWRYYVGATWESTAKTTGTVKIGHYDKDFDSTTRQGDDGVSWEASVQWAPKTYSVIDFTTGQEDKETNGTGNFINSESVALNWNHGWNDFVSTDLGISHSTDTYEGDANGREDTTKSYSAGFNYDMRRWLSLGLSYTYNDTSSNVTGVSYDKNVIFLTVDASL